MPTSCADVAEEDVEHAEQHAEAEGERLLQGEERQEGEHDPAGEAAEGDQDEQEEGEDDGEVDRAGEQGDERQGAARKADLLEQRRVIEKQRHGCG